MPTYQALTPSTHRGKRWKRYTDYRFAAADTLAPLVVQELAKACMSIPIAFVKAGESFLPVALQGLENGKNLFVAPDGRWLGAYVPAQYRSYPFALANAENGQHVLCIDESSPLINDSEGEAFFDTEGKPTQAVQAVLDFLAQVNANREATRRICLALQQQALIQPWPIKLQGAGGEQSLEGLYRIDEAALNQLPAEALAKLRDEAGLTVAYCQLLSMQHLQTLGQLAQAHDQAKAKAQAANKLPTNASGELDLEFLKSSGTISFGQLN